MERTVKAEIEKLEQVLVQLNDELMEEDDLRVRNSLESRVRAADQALQNLHAALELED